MRTNTLALDAHLAYVVAEAFDGDDIHGRRVRALADVLSVARLSSRQLIQWVHETAGVRLSQSTLNRAQSVALALTDAGFPVSDESYDATRVMADLVRLRKLSGVTRMSQVAAQWTPETTVAAFADYVFDALSEDEATVAAAEAAAAQDSQETREIPAADGGTDDGLGAGQDMTGEAVGGGTSAEVTAAKMVAYLRSVAGDINAGRIEPSDELIEAATAIVIAGAEARHRAQALTAETPLSLA